jgi:hypothetical protein
LHLTLNGLALKSLRLSGMPPAVAGQSSLIKIFQFSDPPKAGQFYFHFGFDATLTAI